MRVFFLSACILVLSCNNKDTSVKSVSSDYRTDISDLSKKLLESPDDTSLLKIRSDLFLTNGNLEGALLDQEYLYRLDSNNYQYLSQLASIYYRLAETGKVNYYSKVINLLSKDIVDLKNDIPNLSIRYKLYFIFKKYNESLKDINSVLKQNKFLAEAYFYKGMNNKELGDTVSAISQFQTTVEQDPNFIDAYEQLAFLYAAKNDTIAELYFDNALSIDSTSVALWYNKGKYFQDIGNLSKAKKCYNTILRFDSDFSQAHYNLGYISLLEKQYLDGANYFSDFIYNNNQNAMAYFARGLCFKSLGDNKKARFDFIKTLELDPTFKEAEIELKEVKK